MSSDVLSAESKAALLKDLKELRAQRAFIEASIAKIEAFLGPAAAERSLPKKVKPPADLAGLSTGDACIWLLKPRGHGARMSSRDIADGLATYAYKRKTDQITAALHHRADKKKDVKRDGLHWVYVGEARDATVESPAASSQKGTPSPANAADVSALR